MQTILLEVKEKKQGIITLKLLSLSLVNACKHKSSQRGEAYSCSAQSKVCTE